MKRIVVSIDGPVGSGKGILSQFFREVLEENGLSTSDCSRNTPMHEHDFTIYGDIPGKLINSKKPAP